MQILGMFMVKDGVVVKFIRSRLEFARTKVEGPAKTSVETTLTEILPSIHNTVKMVPTIPLGDVQIIADILVESIATEDAKKVIMDAVYAKVNVSGPSPGEKTKQKIQFPENYQTKDVWTLYGKFGATTYARLFGAAMRLRYIGCVNLDEPSYARMAAIALSEDGLTDVQAALENTQTFKRIFAATAATGFLEGPEEYPTDPADLKETHPFVWEQMSTNGELAPSRLDRGVAAVLKANQPCRNTRTGCMGPVIPRSGGALARQRSSDGILNGARHTQATLAFAIGGRSRASHKPPKDGNREWRYHSRFWHPNTPSSSNHG